MAPNTISFYMKRLRAVYNNAVEDGYVENKNPFKKVFTSSEKTVKRAIPLKFVRKLKDLDLSDKVVALFGCGDSESYGDTFCDGMGLLYENLKNSGCRFIGAVPDADYTYGSSVSVIDGNFVGLAIDDVNESEKTEGRISSWTDRLKADLV